MAVWIEPKSDWDTNRLLGEVILAAKDDARVQFLVEPQAANDVVNRLRVALSRSRNRHRRQGRKVSQFSLLHSIYPYTKDGIRHACIVMWIERKQHHVHRELLDDLIQR